MMYFQKLIMCLRRTLRCLRVQKTGETTPFRVAKPSDQALQTAKSIRGIDREPAIIVHGEMQRSGTNYIAALLRLHPKICAFPNEIYEVPLLKFAGDILDIQNRFFRTYGRNAGRIGSTDFLPLFASSFIAYLYSFVPKGKRMLIKAPNVEHINQFFSCFPYEHLILLLRDGRDLVSSTIKTWPEKNFHDVCKKWNRSTRMVLQFHESYSDKTNTYLMVKYEEVVHDPRTFIRKACERFGLDSDSYPYDRIDEVGIIGSSSIKKSGKVVWTPIAKPANFNPIGRWQEWSTDKKQSFNQIAGRTLIDAGYCNDSSWCE